MKNIHTLKIQDVVSVVILVLSIAATARVYQSARSPSHSYADQLEATSPPAPTDPVVLGDLQYDGSVRARVMIVEVSDFQCPFCRQFAMHTLPTIREEYIKSGKVIFAFDEMPLAFHNNALIAAEAAECAAAEGRFWQMHDELFDRQADLSESTILLVAQRLGLSGDRFGHCVHDHRMLPIIKREGASATEWGATGTPTFFVGILQPDGRLSVQRVLFGAASVREMEQTLNSVLRTVG